MRDMSENNKTENVYEFFLRIYDGIAPSCQIAKWRQNALNPSQACLDVNKEQLNRMKENLKELSYLLPTSETKQKIKHQLQIMCSKTLDIQRLQRKMANK